MSSGVRLHAWLDELRREQKACLSREGRPLITAAFALSQDGCMSASRAGRTILSGEESMRLTHRLRALHDAVLVGVGTVLCDDPLLTTRLVSGRTGLRIVLDSQLRTPGTARVLRAHSTPPLIVGRDSVSRVRVDALREAGADVVLLPGGSAGISLGALFKYLAALGVSGLMVEGGPTVLRSFLRLGYLDQFCVTTTPAFLEAPSAVRMDPDVLEELERWRPAASFHLGSDLVRAGRREMRAGSTHRVRSSSAVPQ
ncbi:MAG TPA: RibD family protein [Myxococcaceae bacterium]|nr:RibD family protein [Myxococcaceae bacterium]